MLHCQMTHYKIIHNATTSTNKMTIKAYNMLQNNTTYYKSIQKATTNTKEQL